MTISRLFQICQLVNSEDAFLREAELPVRKVIATTSQMEITALKCGSVILAAQRIATVESGRTLLSYPSNQRLINRIRQEIQPKIEDDRTSKFTSPEELKITYSGKAIILHYDTGENDLEKILILQQRTTWTPYKTQICDNGGIF